MSTNRVLASGALVALLAVAGLLPGTVPVAWARVPFASAPKPNAVQASFYTFENVAGGLECKPKGAYAQIRQDPYKCYLNIDECKASLDAFTGKLAPEHQKVLADMVRLAKGTDGKAFLGACPGQEGFDHLLGIMGVSYMRKADELPLLLALIEGDRIKKSSGNIRGMLPTALWHMTTKENKDQVIPALQRLLEYETRNDEYKQGIIKYFMRLGADSAVEYCKAALVDTDKKRQKQTCILYLGKTKATPATKLLVRGMEKDEEITARALGLMGDKSQVKLLEEYLDENDGTPHKRMAAVVAMINLGQAAYVKELTLYLQGEKPMSKKELERAKKQKKKKAAKAEYDDNLVHLAAMESVLLQDKKALKAVTAALTKATKGVDKKKWKGPTYATVALAQMGDKKAAKSLAEMLNGTDDNVRKAVLKAIGGAESADVSYWHLYGLGVVGDAVLLPALQEAYEAEGDKRVHADQIRAMATIRTAAELR